MANRPVFERGELNKTELRRLFSQLGFMAYRKPDKWEKVVKLGK